MKKPIQNRKRTLHLLAGLLVASAAIRMTGGTGQALAESIAGSLTEEPVMKEIPQIEEDSGSLYASLLKREERVAERERIVEIRLGAMQETQAEIEEKLTALVEAEERLRATIALADSASESDLSNLTSVYEKMKPKDAAALFEQMAPEFSAGFLSLMRPEAAASIMTLLTPQTAYSISVIIAGRNANVPTD